MSVQRVYVGESGGENLDVARENTNEDTAGKARFEPGDVVEVPEELAERLDRSWASQEEADDMDIEPLENNDEDDQADAEGGDDS
jgi:hypothetical protein